MGASLGATFGRVPNLGRIGHVAVGPVIGDRAEISTCGRIGGPPLTERCPGGLRAWPFQNLALCSSSFMVIVLLVLIEMEFVSRIAV